MIRIVFLLMILGAPAHAAKVTVEKVVWDDGPKLFVVKLSGWIEPGDLDRIRQAFFKAKRRGIDIAGLEMQSDGGDAGTGLNIAAWVHRNRIHVLLQDRCSSACSYAALAAAGAGNLFVRGHVTLGVHQVHDTADGTPAPWWTDRAVRQLRKAGAPRKVLDAMTQTGINGMTTYDTKALLEMGAVNLN